MSDASLSRARLSELQDLLTAALGVEHREQRMLAVAGVVEQVANDLGLRPVLSGGLAVWLWTGLDEFATADVDLVMPSSEEFDHRMALLGFEREGRFRVLRDQELFVEFPGAELPRGWHSTQITTATQLPLSVVTREDMLIDRLHQFAHWHESDAAKQAVVMLLDEDLDRDRLRDRVEAEGLVAAVEALTGVADDIAQDRRTYDDDALVQLARSLPGPGTLE